MANLYTQKTINNFLSLSVLLKMLRQNSVSKVGEVSPLHWCLAVAYEPLIKYKRFSFMPDYIMRKSENQDEHLLWHAMSLLHIMSQFNSAVS